MDPLTYRSSGVDIEANNAAKERIKEHVRRTHAGRVLTRLGLFGGGVSLERFRSMHNPVLCGSIRPGPVGAESAGTHLETAARARWILNRCLEGIPSRTEGVAFLDYLASGKLEASGVEGFVSAFADALLEGPRIPLVGGETAEMPGIFQEGAWETVGALFAVGEEEAAASERHRQGFPSAADLGRIRGLDRPLLILSMDGVGTKTRLAAQAGRTTGIALDILHHSLNDILCQGAEGLAMLYYLGCHAAEARLIDPIRRTAQEACQREGLSLLEFTVVENPAVYRPGEIDLCAAVAGLAEAGRLLEGQGIREGDLLLGLPSSGLHTNGYSLARRALLEKGGMDLGRGLPELGRTLGEALLEPHQSYAPPVLAVLKDAGLGAAVRGIAHITGGGLKDNLARIIPAGLRAEVSTASWDPPPIFRLIQRCGSVPDQDPKQGGMYETFNMGIGMVLVVAPERAADVARRLEKEGERALQIGRVQAAGGSSIERVILQP